MREFHMWLAEDSTTPSQTSRRSRSAAISGTVPIGKEPRCAVRAALEAGSLAADRFASFSKLRHELEYLAQERREHTYISRRRESGILRVRIRYNTPDSGE